MLTRQEYFPGYTTKEQIALFIRRHWITFVPWVLISLLLVFTSIVTFIFGWAMIPPDDSSAWRALVIFGHSMWLLSVLFIFLRSWLCYYLDVTIVTERRLIDIEQQGIFVRRISEQSLLRVRDVSARQKGIIQHFFNFGTLYIETANEQPNVEINGIPRPNEVAKTILNLHDRLLGTGGAVAEVTMAETGRYTEIETETAETAHHPLEDLRTYFPEPNEVPVYETNADDPEQPKPTVSPKDDGDVPEGETIRITPRT